MTAYRRNFIPGGCFFFTVNLADRRLRLLTENIEALRSAFREIRRRHPFAIDAMVVLPDHLHAVWTLPEGDRDFSTRWRLIKSTFSRNLGAGEPISASRAAKRERGIWQRRYWEHTIRDEDDLGVTSTTFISIRSSMDSWNGSGIGNIRRSIGWCSLESILRIGAVTPQS
ncbi:REP element-mobilizing transposase RayT [Bradyrhizobium sp. AZCC 1610]